MLDFGGWCSDFSVTQRIALTMDLPGAREPTLELFDRVRREIPRLSHIRRSGDEVVLESEADSPDFMWLALRRTEIRSGYLNPASSDEAYAIHRTVLETAPWFLSLTPLDFECVELTFGLDIEVESDRDSVVSHALLGGSALALLIDSEQESAIDVQPFVGISLTPTRELQASFEVKTRARAVGSSSSHPGPISIYVTVRRNGPLTSLSDLPTIFATLCGHAERLCEERAIPHLVMPIRQAIGAV